MLLEASFHALENAGLSVEHIAGTKTSVYMGTSSRDYETLQSRDPTDSAKYLGTGIGTSLLSNRISWFFDFKAPSLSLDTACSSSLTGVHLACESLRSGESDMAIAGGVNLIIAPDSSFMHLGSMGFLSPDGRCYSFDSKANGYAKGEGVGLVVIKRLDDAIKDGDTIRAVIKASAVNQDGRTPGITQPSQIAQESNIRHCYENANLDADLTHFVEAHGTGTQVGDPIEAGAIAAAFSRPPNNPLYIGAAKTNVGHLEAGAGAVALIKTVLVLEKGLIPPNALYEAPNENINLKDWSIRFPVDSVPWPVKGLRRASVNSFGYGGTNAHVVLDDAQNTLKMLTSNDTDAITTFNCPRIEQESVANADQATDTDTGIAPHDPKSAPQLFVFSAADEAGLVRLIQAYASHMAGTTTTTPESQRDYLRDLAFTLLNKRSLFPWRSFTIAHSLEELSVGLASGISKPVRARTEPAVSFIFTGQGAQWCGMGKDLLRYSAFLHSLERAQRRFDSLNVSWSLFTYLESDGQATALDDPELAQPICTALQLALVDLYRDWNVVPHAVVGHSSGEIAAAYACGAVSFESALNIAFHRGALCSRLVHSDPKPGAMASVSMSEEGIIPYLERAMVSTTAQAVVACVNSPKNVTISGDRACVDRLVQMMESEGVFARKLNVSVAYHSPQMDAIKSDYVQAIGEIAPGKDDPSLGQCVSFHSSARRSGFDADMLRDPAYWVMNAVSPVRFSDALTELLQHRLPATAKSSANRAKEYLLEIGPHAALQRPVNDTAAALSLSDRVAYDSVLQRSREATSTALHAIGQLYCAGFPVRNAAFNVIPASPEERSPKMVTDLPPYPFDHSQTYWHESRLSTNFRFRDHAPHKLLGLRAMDWNPLQPRWRNIINTEENAWILDHRMNGVILYPAAGMLVMAIEAARQLASKSWSVTGYRISDVRFLRAIEFKVGVKRVETELSFQPSKGSGLPAREHSFRLSAYQNKSWLLIAEGSIALETSQDSTESATGLAEPESYQQTYRDCIKSCTQPIDPKSFYKSAAEIGCDYGPAHQGLKDMKVSTLSVTAATIDMKSWAGARDTNLQDDCVIHPTDLDAIAQLTLVSLSHGGSVKIPTIVPTKARSIWISHALLDAPEGAKLNACCKPLFQGYREADFLIQAFDEEGSVQIEVEEWREMAITNIGTEFLNTSQQTRPFYTMEWKPDVDLMTPLLIRQYCESRPSKSSNATKALVAETELISLYFMTEVSKEMIEEQCLEGPEHLRRYMKWLRRCLKRDAVRKQASEVSDGHRFLDDAMYRDGIVNKFANDSSQGALTVAVGRQLPDILRGIQDPLEVLFGNNLVEDWYAGEQFQGLNAEVASYMELKAHKNPNLHVLEIGAGTGGATRSIFHVLSRPEVGASAPPRPRLDRYDFTDISPAFFEDARNRFRDYEAQMRFMTLDIERDPTSQGFAPESYDVVVCSLVLHATKNIADTLQHVHKVLKPGGKLLFLEPTNVDVVRVSFVFGLLPGWWLGIEPDRAWGPCISTAAWDQRLLDNGFEGVETTLDGLGDPEHQTYSWIVSTVRPSRPLASGSDASVSLVLDESNAAAKDLATCIIKSFREKNVSSAVTSWENIDSSASVPAGSYIVLQEVQRSWLSHISSSDFASLQRLVENADHILWVTRDTGHDSKSPEYDIVTGLARNARSENFMLDFTHLSLDPTYTLPTAAAHTVEMFIHQQNTVLEQSESEYMHREGMPTIGRVIEDPAISQHISARNTRQAPTAASVKSIASRALKMTIGTPGLLDTFFWDDDFEAERPLGASEIEVNPVAIGLNFKDVLIALGNIPGGSLGFECAGFVSRVGVDASLQPGDRVLCGTMTGALKTRVRADCVNVVKLDTSIGFETAASLLVVYATAYHALYTVAHLEKDESVLIHSGAGGVGQAAIQLASLRQARIFTTAGTPEKRGFLSDRFGIPKDHVFSSRDSVFAKAIQRLTLGSGVDVILNSTSDQLFRASWSCVAPLGRFVEIGKTDIMSGRALDMDPFSKGVTFAAVDLGALMNSKKAVMKRTLDDIMTLCRDGAISSPHPVQVFPISDTEAAFRSLQGGKVIGKLVLKMSDEDVIPVSEFCFVCKASANITTGCTRVEETL